MSRARVFRGMARDLPPRSLLALGLLVPCVVVGCSDVLGLDAFTDAEESSVAGAGGSGGSGGNGGARGTSSATTSGAGGAPRPGPVQPGDGDGVVLAASQLWLGDTHRDASKSPSAWSDYGLDLDGLDDRRRSAVRPLQASRGGESNKRPPRRAEWAQQCFRSERLANTPGPGSIVAERREQWPAEWRIHVASRHSRYGGQGRLQSTRGRRLRRLPAGRPRATRRERRVAHRFERADRSSTHQLAEGVPSGNLPDGQLVGVGTTGRRDRGAASARGSAAPARSSRGSARSDRWRSTGSEWGGARRRPRHRAASRRPPHLGGRARLGLVQPGHVRLLRDRVARWVGRGGREAVPLPTRPWLCYRTMYSAP
jgi:hypothetical protein